MEPTLAHAHSLIECEPQTAWQMLCGLEQSQPIASVSASLKQVMGNCLITLGRFAEARTYLLTARDQAQAHAQPDLASCCERDAAVAAYFLGQHGQAKQEFERALNGLPADHLPLERSSCLRWMALMANYRYETELAQGYLQAAEALLGPTAPPADLANCQFVAGLIASRRADYAAAQSLLSAAGAAYVKLGLEVTAGRVACELGYTLRNLEDLEGAQAVAQQALAIFERHRLPHRIGIASELLGTLAMVLNQFEAALQYLTTAHAAYRAANMQVLAVQALLHRANLDYYLEAWQIAEASYQEVLAQAEALDLRHLACLAQLNLGTLACDQRRFDAAVVFVQQALETAKQLEQWGDIAHCHRQLSRISIALGQAEQVQVHYQAMLAALAQHDLPLSLARAQAEYAAWLEQQGEYAQAEWLLIKAHAILCSTGSPMFVADCERQWASVALAQNKRLLATWLLDHCRQTYLDQHLSLAQARVAHVDGDLWVALGYPAAASAAYRRAWQQLAHTLPAEASVIATKLAALTQAQAPRVALQWLIEANLLTQQVRSRVATAEFSSVVAQQHAPHLLSALQLALNINEPLIGLALAENARAQVAQAWLSNVQQRQPSTPAIKRLASRCFALRTMIEQAEQAAFAMIPADQPRRPLTTPGQLQTLYQEYDAALALWRRSRNGIVPGMMQPFDWQACAAQLAYLPPGSQVLVYWLQDAWLIGWHCTTKGVQFWQHHLSFEDLSMLEECCDPRDEVRSYVYDWSASEPSFNPAKLEHVARLLLPSYLAPSQPDDLLIIIPAGQLPPCHSQRCPGTNAR